MSESKPSVGQYAFYDHKPGQSDMEMEVLAGLRSDPKYVSPKYFYDERGSKLFEQITVLDEYYLTRTEMALFDTYLPEVAKELGDNLCLIEYGSGSSVKIRKLLEAISPRAYVPVDISHAHLQENARALHADFPSLDVYPVCADFTTLIELPPDVDHLTPVGFFPGSSIGNFSPQDAAGFLRNVRATVGKDGALVIGVDRKKSKDVLESAYNDASGVTAAFNLNVLSHINSELAADFETTEFEHRATYNEEEGCIQMFLESKQDQAVTVAGVTVDFAASEVLHTENSYKYHPEEFLRLCEGAGFVAQACYSDDREWFSLYLLRGV